MRYTELNFSNYPNKKVEGCACFTLSSKCSNYNIRCNICVRVQGKYTQFKEKDEAIR